MLYLFFNFAALVVRAILVAVLRHAEKGRRRVCRHLDAPHAQAMFHAGVVDVATSVNPIDRIRRAAFERNVRPLP